MTQRLQVLIDDERYSHLRQEAERTGTPVGELVRAAIDAWLEEQADREAMAAAAQHILDSRRPAGQEPDWREAKGALLDGLYRG